MKADDLAELVTAIRKGNIDPDAIVATLSDCHAQLTHYEEVIDKAQGEQALEFSRRSTAMGHAVKAKASCAIDGSLADIAREIYGWLTDGDAGTEHPPEAGDG